MVIAMLVIIMMVGITQLAIVFAFQKYQNLQDSREVFCSKLCSFLQNFVMQPKAARTHDNKLYRMFSE